MSQSKLEVITCCGRDARENAHKRGTIRHGCTSDWLKNWREFLSQSQRIISAKAINSLSALK